MKYDSENKEAEIFKGVNVTVKYRTPLEFSLTTKSINHNRIKIKLETWSDRKRKAKLYLKISNETWSETFEKEIELKKGHEMNVFYYQMFGVGRYVVEGILISDGIEVGPRESFFEMHPKKKSK
ncbi:MAG: hypothetical protein DRP11_02850 [Candidatus Aenigmatarchaeota archaeon]|nr:MAG: hypothetical protein DRP11_02850 [Candidatus Aenigmarchaeota archaeon]